MGLKDLFKSAPVDVKQSVASRARIVPTHGIPEWVHQTISATGVNLRDYERERKAGALDEAIMNAETTLSLLRVLKERVEEP